MTPFEQAAQAEALRIFPDETEQLQWPGGRTIDRISVDRGNLRYALVRGAMWASGGWDRHQGATPLPIPLDDDYFDSHGTPDK